MTTPNLSRRQFLQILAFGSVAAGLAYRSRSVWFAGEASSAFSVIHQTRYLMGTVINLTLVGEDQADAEHAASAAIGEMGRLVGVFNRYDSASQLSQLNQFGRLQSPDLALVNLLRQAERISAATGGAFDVSVKPLVDLYEAYQTQKLGLPGSSEVKTVLDFVGFEKIVCSEDEIALADQRMGLTLDGIAKGAVIDGGLEKLRACGYSDVIVEAGGDLIASGMRADETPWRVGVDSPRNAAREENPVLLLSNMAVATSGDYIQTYTSDYSAHHIIDPRQGFSPKELASAAVVGPSTFLADALATAVMVAGVSDGIDLLDAFPGCEALLVDKEGQMHLSSGMASYMQG